ncbi:alpha/beta fold hydrolase [Swingsia samuiensis]|uniref:Alpha/beta fold hydrolase n=1 Tax=Swingsia samuiensis TaxID=1293412 RepID=A0A4Y6UJ52_9PROT|nr:alpha/beta fold hydrolase [Swingsia samuiensis]QDH16850.1 alpha/beta fold hydrolase [Swingsia samuiensis]
MLLNTIQRGEGPETVVFLHGLFGRARNLGFLQREAASQNFRTIALDLRNHGDSPHGPVTYHNLAQDVFDTLESMNISSFSLVGHSMGGKVAMLMALMSPEKISKILVGDMAPIATHQGHKEMIAQLAQLRFPEQLTKQQALALLEPITGSQAVSELMLQNIALDIPARWHIGFDDIANGIDEIETWPNVKLAPFPNDALFLRGALSPYVQERAHKPIYELFPKAKIQSIENAGHWLHAEKPKEFSEIMMSFLIQK